MKFFNYFVLLAALSLTACTSKEQIRKALKEDPSILVDAVKEHPLEILSGFQEAAGKAAELQAKKQMEEDLKNPKKPEITDDRIITGSKDAPITIVEYSDFQCGYCAKAHDEVKKVMKKHGKDVRFVYKHFPTVGPHAELSAIYYEAIGKQSPEKAIKFHDLLFQNQKKISGESFLKNMAKKAGANMAKLAKDVKSDELKKRVASDKAEAIKFGFSGTPGFLINGLPIRGYIPASGFDQKIEQVKSMNDKKDS